MLGGEQDITVIRTEIETRIVSGKYSIKPFNIPINSLGIWPGKLNPDIWNSFSPFSDPAHLIVRATQPKTSARLSGVLFWKKEDITTEPGSKTLELDLRQRFRPELTTLVYLLELVDETPPNLKSFIRKLILPDETPIADQRLMQREATYPDLEFFYKTLRAGIPVK